MGDWRTKLPLLLGGVAAGLLVLLLAVPLVALVWRTLQLGALGPALRNPTVIAALQLSLLTACVSLAVAILLGTPLAYALARIPFPGRGAVEALVEVPIVLPPAVAGIALLMAFGRRGLLGAPLADAGISLAFTTAAVVVAQCFVAVPFYVRSAKAGFLGVDQDLERTAYTLGESPCGTFWRVTVPSRLPLPAGRGRAVLGAGPGGVRGHDHVRRLLPGAHPDHAPGHLRRPGVRPGGRPGPGHDPGAGLHRRPGPGALGDPAARSARALPTRWTPRPRAGRLRRARPGRAAAAACTRGRRPRRPGRGGARVATGRCSRLDVEATAGAFRLRARSRWSAGARSSSSGPRARARACCCAPSPGSTPPGGASPWTARRCWTARGAWRSRRSAAGWATCPRATPSSPT